uniref:Uncharacterized protein n=1 Tax=Salmo trutta TaxID=8032 RepID=A0A674DBB8_SALTR
MAVLKWLSICLTLWTQFRLGRLNDVSIALLSDMVRNLNCTSPENVEQTFPEDLYKNTEGEDVYVVALEAMRYVEQLYNNSLTSVTWNKTKLNMFQNVIYRQVQNLELCVVGGVWESSGDGWSVTLKTYFNKLNTVLKEKEHSACAWEIVRKEIRENLVQFKKFIDSRVKP